jgi:hypothetical protein
MNGRRILRWALWALAFFVVAAPLALWAAYPAITRRLLAGPALRKAINVRPQEFFIDWKEAASPRLGHVTIRNLTLRGSDPYSQWTVTVERVELDVSLLALAFRTLRCRELSGSGLSFALRGKLPPGSTAADAALLPPIPGFSDPPLRSPGDRFYVDPKAWVVDMRHVAIDRVESLWIDGFRYTGKGRVEGAFYLRPLQQARIDTTTLSLEEGPVRIGNVEGVTLSGTVKAFSRPFDPLRSLGAEGLKVFSADLKLAARTERLDSLGALVPLPEGAGVESGAATLALEGSVRQGVAEGSLSLAVKDGAIHIPRYRIRGDAQVDVPLRRWNLLGGPFDLSGTKVGLTRVHATGGSEPLREWWGRVEIPSGRLGRTVSARVQLHCRDARPLLALLGVSLPPWTKGLVSLDDFSASAALTAAPSRLRVGDLEANGGDFHVLGQFANDGKLGRGAFLIESGVLVVGIEIAPPQKTKVRPFFAKQWYEKLPKSPVPSQDDRRPHVGSGK